jgi:hypothetical protein
MDRGQDVLSDFERASRHEWRWSDGLGGYAAGTASGAPTRRAHALLAVAEPLGVTTLVLRFEEKLALGSAVHDLSAAFSAGRARAGAFAQLEAFVATPWPCWRWRIDDTVIERSLQPIDGHAALLASWHLFAGPGVRLSVAPVLTARAPHELLRESADFRGAAQGIPGRVRFETLPGRPGVTLWHNGAFLPARGWSRALSYPLDLASEDDGTAPELAEDGFVPGWVQADLAAPGSALHLVLSPEEGLFRALAAENRLGTPPARTLHECATTIARGAAERRGRWRRQAIAGADFTARQAAVAHGGEGAEHARRSEPLVGAGEPLVESCIERLLEGLERRGARVTLASRRPGARELGSDTLRAAAALVSLRVFDPARAIAEGYLDWLDEGLAPESFAADGTPRYGDPEPSLWLVHLVDLLARRGGEPAARDVFLRERAWPALESVLQAMRSGSRHGVRCDADGLLWAGEGSAARARAGTNALWYHALVAMAQLGRLLGHREHAAFYLAWAHELQARFPDRFWDEAAGALFDVLTPEGPVRGVSPAQLLAVSLPPALLAPPHAQRLVATLERELLAPGGLRERPGEPDADAAWLGTWAAARMRAGSRDAASRAALAARFERVAASPPLDPLGAAEVLRGWIEEGERAGLAEAAR